MKNNYDFSDAIKNPFAGKFNGKYTVTIHYDFTDESETKKNDTTKIQNKLNGYTHEPGDFITAEDYMKKRGLEL